MYAKKKINNAHQHAQTHTTVHKEIDADAQVVLYNVCQQRRKSTRQ